MFGHSGMSDTDPTTSELLAAAKAAYYARLKGADVEEFTAGGITTRYGSLSNLKQIISELETTLLMEQGASRPCRITLPGRYS